MLHRKIEDEIVDRLCQYTRFYVLAQHIECRRRQLTGPAHSLKRIPTVQAHSTVAHEGAVHFDIRHLDLQLVRDLRCTDLCLTLEFRENVPGSNSANWQILRRGRMVGGRIVMFRVSTWVLLGVIAASLFAWVLRGPTLEGPKVAGWTDLGTWGWSGGNATAAKPPVTAKVVTEKVATPGSSSSSKAREACED